MPRFIVLALKVIAIIFAPIAILGLIVSRQAVSGDQYVAVLEIIGTNSKPGAIEIFGADIQTVASLLNFFEAWSLPALIAMVALAIIGLALSEDKLRATWHICLGLFFSFGIWAAFLSQSRQAFTDVIGSEISDLSGIVIAAYLSELSAKLLNLIGLLALLFGALAFIFWIAVNRRKARSSYALN
jgi:hypothetical protein